MPDIARVGHDLVSSICKISSPCATPCSSSNGRQRLTFSSVLLTPLQSHIETKPTFFKLTFFTCRGGWLWCRSLGSELLRKTNSTERQQQQQMIISVTIYSDLRIHWLCNFRMILNIIENFDTTGERFMCGKLTKIQHLLIGLHICGIGLRLQHHHLRQQMVENVEICWAAARYIEMQRLLSDRPCWLLCRVAKLIGRLVWQAAPNWWREET